MLKLKFASLVSMILLTACNATTSTTGSSGSESASASTAVSPEAAAPTPSSSSSATAGTTSTVASSPVVSPGLDGVTVPSPTPSAPATFSQTYYRIIQTVAPLGSYPTETYAAKGYCVTYKSNSYCWDDGMQTLEFTISGTVHGPYTYTYWGLGTTSVGNGWGQCSGGCSGDLMSTPILMTSDIQTNLPSGVSLNKMLTTGTALTTNCTEGNQVLSCADFTIDLNQTAL